MLKVLKKIKGKLTGRREQFDHLCKTCQLDLNYDMNQNEFDILKSIFIDREYADYFPFYQKVNIIDIGGHYGYFSIFAHQNTDKDSQIISIEPSQENFKQLNKNIADCNIKNLRSINAAIGAQNGVSKLYKGQNVNHSIVENYTLSADSAFENITTKTLETVMQEHNIEKIDFLKLDCEGAEYAILEQTPAAVFDKITTISMEFHDLKDQRYTGETIINILLKNKFTIVKYQYEKTNWNLNYGKIIGTKILNQ